MDVNMLPALQFNFDKRGCRNMALSDFLGMKRTELTARPLYITEKDLTLWGKQWTASYVSMFLPENPGYKVCGCTTVGYHTVDVEKVILLRDKETKIYEWVFFGAHSNAEGMWMPWKSCMFTESGALRVFVSPTSNAMYPAPRRYRRILGFADDDCRGCDEAWSPSGLDFTDSHVQGWSLSLGGVIVTGINAPNNVRPPPEESITDVQRFFLLVPQVRAALQKGKTGSFF